MALEITDDNILSVLKDNKITVIDFWAPWCGPCRMLSPIIDGLVDDNEDIVIGKMNVDEQPLSPSKFGIRGIPTIIFFKDGEIVEKVVGAKSKDAYQTIIDKLKS
jgi:thioredoxin 1